MVGMLQPDAQSSPAPSPAAAMAPPAQPAQSAPAAPDAAAPQSATDPQDQQPNVTPQEQQQYNEFVANGLKLIYDPKTLPGVVQRLKGGGDPIEGLAGAASTLVLRLQDSAESKGVKIDSDVLFQGGKELLEELATLAQRAGIHDYTDKELEGALYRGLDLYRGVEQARGGIHKDVMQKDLAQLNQADQSGELERAFPGLKEHAAQLAQSAQQQPSADAQQPQQQQPAGNGMLAAGG